jgi:beta-phosphoglucomutase-like phosphatase (HAD superfamily)
MPGGCPPARCRSGTRPRKLRQDDRHDPDLRALIRDVDGTLADTEHLHRAAFNEAFARAGLGWQWDANTYRRRLKEARAAGLRLAIATTTSPPNVDALLRLNLGPAWRDWFEVVEDGETAPRRKPDPQVYARALARLGLGPRQRVAFEDSITGLHAAIAAGVPVVVAPSHYTRHDDFCGAMRVVPDLGDVRLADVRGWHAATCGSDTTTA